MNHPIHSKFTLNNLDKNCDQIDFEWKYKKKNTKKNKEMWASEKNKSDDEKKKLFK